MQPLLPCLMRSMPLRNLAQTIPHQELIICRGEECRRHVDQYRNPAVVQVTKRFPAEEDSGNDPGSQVTSEVRGDGNVGETPDHGCVGETDGEGGGGGGYEGVGGVEARPDYDADVGVYEEFGEEEVAEVAGQLVSNVTYWEYRGEMKRGKYVRLCRVRKRAKNTRRPTVRHQRFPSRQRLRLERLNFRPVHSHK